LFETSSRPGKDNTPDEVNPLECGGKRSATPPWIFFANQKRRRAALAAALQGVVLYKDLSGLRLHLQLVNLKMPSNHAPIKPYLLSDSGLFTAPGGQ
jgi:hypothetical protein